MSPEPLLVVLDNVAGLARQLELSTSVVRNLGTDTVDFTGKLAGFAVERACVDGTDSASKLVSSVADGWSAWASAATGNVAIYDGVDRDHAASVEALESMHGMSGN